MSKFEIVMITLLALNLVINTLTVILQIKNVNKE